MVHLGPLSHLEIGGQDVTDCIRAEPAPWTMDHQVHVFAQTESRPGPLTDEGERWMECQQTGKVMVVCTCGYTSGLIDRTELEGTVAGLAAEEERTALLKVDPPANVQVRCL